MVTQSDIQALAEKIAIQFRPKRIYLFGSYAYGAPTADSDVDLLVEIAHEGKPASTATRMRRQVKPEFAVDLIVRSPETLRQRIALNDWFLRDIVEHGKVLYESTDG